MLATCDMTFSPKVAYITGGSSGIGKAFAEAFHKRGIQVVIGGRRANKLQARASARAGLPGVWQQTLPVHASQNAPLVRMPVRLGGFLLCSLHNAAPTLLGMFGRMSPERRRSATSSQA